MKILGTTTTLRMYIPEREGAVYVGNIIRVAGVGQVLIRDITPMTAKGVALAGHEHTGDGGLVVIGELQAQVKDTSLREDMAERRILAGLSGEARNWWL